MTANKTNRKANKPAKENSTAESILPSTQVLIDSIPKKPTKEELLKQLAVVVVRAKVQDYRKSSKVLDIVADFYRIVSNQCVPVSEIRKAQKFVFHLQDQLLEHEAMLDLGKRVYGTDFPRVLSYKITLTQSHQVLVMMRLMNG